MLPSGSLRLNCALSAAFCTLFKKHSLGISYPLVLLYPYLSLCVFLLSFFLCLYLFALSLFFLYLYFSINFYLPLYISLRIYFSLRLSTSFPFYTSYFLPSYFSRLLFVSDSSQHSITTELLQNGTH